MKTSVLRDVDLSITRPPIVQVRRLTHRSGTTISVDLQPRYLIPQLLSQIAEIGACSVIEQKHVRTKSRSDPDPRRDILKDQRNRKLPPRCTKIPPPLPFQELSRTV